MVDGSLSSHSDLASFLVPRSQLTLMQSGQCCRCNGTCVRCDCTKAARKCWSCLPSKKDRCKNSAIPSPPQPELSTATDNQTAGTATVQDNATGRVRTDDASVDASAATAVSCSQQFAWDTLDRAAATTTSREAAALTNALLAECRASEGTELHSQNSSQAAKGPTNDADVGDVTAERAAQHRDHNTPSRTIDGESSSLERDVDLLAHLADSPTPVGAVQAELRTAGEDRDVVRDLPIFEEDGTDCVLGPHTAPDVNQVLSSAYAEAVHFRGNLFEVPSGAVGSEFVRLIASYYQMFGSRGAGAGVAIQAAMVATQLLLQRPHQCKDQAVHRECLGRRLQLWTDGNINELIIEARTIQRQLAEAVHNPRVAPGSDNARQFASMVKSGKLKAAAHMLSNERSGGLHHLNTVMGDTTVREALKAKHPCPRPLQPAAVIQGTPPDPPHPVLFTAINRELIRRAALNTQGAAGPSGQDAANWRRMCTSFGRASDDLCDALASSARRIASSQVDPASLQAYVACRLVPLDKKPGVRPIGIGEIVRRILGKAILYVLGPAVQQATGSLQLCGGQESGIEAAIHAMREAFDADEVEGVLFADATNAFNNLNRQACLRNVQHLCPDFAATLANTYRKPAAMFVDGETIWSAEGTTQGDPLAMPMFALGTVPLIQHLSASDVLQSWYADDANSAGKLRRLRAWWDMLGVEGEGYGYYLNAAKSVLLVKPQHEELAREIFSGTDIVIRTDGQRHLGAALGTEAFCNEYVQLKVDGWCTEVCNLAAIAMTQPQAAYVVFTNVLRHRWSFLSRTMPGVHEYFHPLERTIATKLIPALTGRSPLGAEERSILAMPCRHGGLGIVSPPLLTTQFGASVKITEALVMKIRRQDMSLEGVSEQTRIAKSAVREAHRQQEEQHRKDVFNSVSPDLQRCMELAAEKGASNWLTCRPLAWFGLALSKAEFRDALCLRYGWQPNNLPTKCVCGQQFTVTHAVSCPNGGFPSIRHNEIRDVFAECLVKVAHAVEIEPHLEPLSGEHLQPRTAVRGDQARLDVVANGVYGGRFERSFLDVSKGFQPLCSL